MRKLFVLLILPFILGCPYPYEYDFYSEYKPVLMKRSVLINSVKFVESQPLKNPGKIYVKDNLLFINEKHKGIHVYNNANPSSPQKIGFIQVPGIVDIAMKEDVIYADNATDLVAIDISGGLSTLQVVKRIENVFPELPPPDGRSIPVKYSLENRPDNTVVIEWILDETE